MSKYRIILVHPDGKRHPSIKGVVTKAEADAIVKRGLSNFPKGFKYEKEKVC